jgi:L-histidine Nalpha-methyltransferase
VQVRPLKRSYLDGLAFARSTHRNGVPRLVLFLGGTIGNFHRPDAAEFLRSVRDELSPGDAFLLGADLEKPASVLLPAYDDPAGVTAAFNLNLLAHINRALDANFDLKGFSHEARFDERERRIEMHLRSKRRRVVVIPGAGLTVEIQKGETLWTESSYRYNVKELRALAAKTGFREAITWVDEEWPFASTLWIAQA